MSTSHTAARMACLVAFIVAGNAMAKDTPPDAPRNLDVTVKLSGGVMAAGVGYKWGHGTLMYHGQPYPFCIRGLSLGDVGAVKVDAQGAVYNLKGPDDFAGKYFTLSGGFTLARGESGTLLKNKQGVEIELETLETGLRFNVAAGGLRIALAGQRGCKAR